MDSHVYWTSPTAIDRYFDVPVVERYNVMHRVDRQTFEWEVKWLALWLRKFAKTCMNDRVPVDYPMREFEIVIENSLDAEKISSPIAHFDFSFAFGADLATGITSTTERLMALDPDGLPTLGTCVT